MSNQSFRYDVAPIDKYEVTPEGYLRAWATIARTGVQHYSNADGSIRREYRPETEVAAPESLASFAGKAITLEHPPVLLDSENTKDYQIGFSGTEIVYDNGFVRAVMTITDKDAIESIMRGDAREVSAGYKVSFEPTPGVTEKGENYDGVQTGIMGNHIAVVRRGRAGPQVKLHLDRQDAADPSLITQGENSQMTTAKVAFDGAEMEVSEGVALAINKERADAKKSYQQMKDEYDALNDQMMQLKKDMELQKKDMELKKDSEEGRADALAEEVEVLKQELATIQEINIDSLVEERLALIDKARPCLDSAFEFTGKSAREIMEAAIVAVRGDSVELSERSDDYVGAMFDTLVEVKSRNDSVQTDELRKTVASIASTSAPSSYMDRLQNAWKTPLSVTKEAR